jgi:hypothetical protein
MEAIQVLTNSEAGVASPVAPPHACSRVSIAAIRFCAAARPQIFVLLVLFLLLPEFSARIEPHIRLGASSSVPPLFIAHEISVGASKG